MLYKFKQEILLERKNWSWKNKVFVLERHLFVLTDGYSYNIGSYAMAVNLLLTKDFRVTHPLPLSYKSYR
jgi:hypothetical protein